MCDPSVLIEQLRATDIELHEKAAYTYYLGTCDVAPGAEIVNALIDSVRSGNLSPAAFLLIGKSGHPSVAVALSQVREEHGDQMTKLNPWDMPITVADALLLPLSKSGDVASRQVLLERIEDNDPAILTYLLNVAGDVDSPEILHALGRVALKNHTEILGGVPSGAAPARRVADLSVDALVDRLSLDVDFALRPSQRYTDGEISQVSEAMARAIPQ